MICDAHHGGAFWPHDMQSEEGAEMRRKITSGMTMRLLICSLGTAASCILLCAQDQAESGPKSELFLGMLVDTSTHQKRVIEFEREVVNSILDRFYGMATEGFVIKYSDKIELLQDWSPLETERNEVAAQIELDVESSKRNRTLLNDALNAGLLKLKERSDSGSKVLIIIGEGNDSGSVTRYSEIKKLARSAHVQCFALLVADHDLMGGRIRHFGFDLYDLAGATKGKGYDIGASRKHLDKAIKDMLERIH